MSILDTAKDVVELVQKADNIDLYRHVLDLQGEIMELRQDNRTLRDEIADLGREHEISASLVFESNTCNRVDAGQKIGPYCALCWD